MRPLTTIQTETVARCGLADVESLVTSPVGWALWPGVEAVQPADDGAFALHQMLDLPFFGVARHAFHVTIDAVEHGERSLDVRWHTNDWQFSRRGEWRARVLRTRTRLTLVCEDELDEARFEHALNAYRATSVWPMRHDHTEVLTLLTLDFLRDKLVADDTAFVKAARRCLQRRDTKE